jgi:hypothetical protein
VGGGERERGVADGTMMKTSEGLLSTRMARGDKYGYMDTCKRQKDYLTNTEDKT